MDTLKRITFYKKCLGMPYRRRYKKRKPPLQLKAKGSPEVMSSLQVAKPDRIPRRLYLNPDGDLPQRLLVNFRYSESNIAMSGLVAAGTAYFLFKLNSLYDFNGTGTGHQPAPYDAMATLYTSYAVRAGKVKVQMENKDVDEKLTWGLLVSDIAPASAPTLDGLKRSSHVSMTLDPADPASSGERGTLEVYCNYKKYFPDFDEAADRASFGGDPSDLLYLIIYAVSSNETQLDTEPTFSIDATLYSEIFDPKFERAID